MRRQERIGREASAQGARPAQIFLEGTGKRLAVRGHRGILEYTAEVLRLRLPGMKRWGAQNLKKKPASFSAMRSRYWTTKC